MNQQPMQGQQQRQQAFGGKKEDAIAFLKNAVEIIHNEQFQQSFMAALQKGDPVQVIGSQAATVLHRLISVMRQERGAPIHEGAAIKGIEFVVHELAAIAKMIGIELNPEQIAQAGGVAGDMVEKLMDAPQGGQPQQGMQPQQAPSQQQQQGLMGGM